MFNVLTRLTATRRQRSNAKKKGLDDSRKADPYRSQDQISRLHNTASTLALNPSTSKIAELKAKETTLYNSITSLVDALIAKDEAIQHLMALSAAHKLVYDAEQEGNKPLVQCINAAEEQLIALRNERTKIAERRETLVLERERVTRQLENHERE